MRLPGISTPAVQTARYSGQAAPEIRIEGMEPAGEFREPIRPLVRQRGTSRTSARVTAGLPATDPKNPGKLVKNQQLPAMQRKKMIISAL